MGAVKMQRNSLEISTIGAKFDDFDFELPLSVTGFKFKVPRATNNKCKWEQVR